MNEWTDDELKLELFDKDGNELTPHVGGGWRWFIPSWDELDTAVIEHFDEKGNITSRKVGPSGWPRRG